MHNIKYLAGAAIMLLATNAIATPRQLITHNNTNVESNAYIDGVPSIYPTKAQSTGKIFWAAVKMACVGHAVNGKCSAAIIMGANSSNPITIGNLVLDLTSGDISPKTLSANGYTVVVNAPGETTLSSD